MRNFRTMILAAILEKIRLFYSCYRQCTSVGLCAISGTFRLRNILTALIKNGGGFSLRSARGTENSNNNKFISRKAWCTLPTILCNVITACLLFLLIPREIKSKCEFKCAKYISVVGLFVN